MTARHSSVRPSSRTSFSTTRALGGDDAGVEAREVQAAMEARVLDLHAAVGDDVEPGRGSDLRRLVGVQPELHPERARARLDRLARHARQLIGAAEDVDDVRPPRKLGERRVARHAEDLRLVRRDRPDLVVRARGEQVRQHEVRGACRVRRRADDRDRTSPAEDREALPGGHPSARSRSKMMSSTSSMPTLMRTSSGRTPAASSASVESWRWVVEPGWITSVRVSPTLARCEHSSTRPMNASPAARPPSQPNENTAPGPLGRYFCASAWLGWDGSPAKRTQLTRGSASSHSAIACAFLTCASIRSGSVSIPCRIRKALNGDSTPPRLRSPSTRSFVANPYSPKLSQKRKLP